MIHLQETNVKLKGNMMGAENPMSIVSIADNKGNDAHSSEIISLLQQENRVLREDLEQQARKTSDKEFECDQMKQ